MGRWQWPRKLDRLVRMMAGRGKRVENGPYLKNKIKRCTNQLVQQVNGELTTLTHNTFSSDWPDYSASYSLALPRPS